MRDRRLLAIWVPLAALMIHLIVSMILYLLG